jgi:hypothetical protein
MNGLLDVKHGTLPTKKADPTEPRHGHPLGMTTDRGLLRRDARIYTEQAK